MPSPIAHAAMGLLLHRTLGSPGHRPAAGGDAARFAGPLIAIGLSLLPDLDWVPGLLHAQPGIWHNQGSHSLAAGLVVTLLLAPLLQAMLGGESRRWLALVGACYLMHLLMDTCGSGRGVRLLWPFSLERYGLPVPLFAGVRWEQGLLSAKHLWTLANELAFATLLWAGYAFFSRGPTSQQKRGGPG